MLERFQSSPSRITNDGDGLAAARGNRPRRRTAEIEESLDRIPPDAHLRPIIVSKAIDTDTPMGPMGPPR